MKITLGYYHQLAISHLRVYNSHCTSGTDTSHLCQPEIYINIDPLLTYKIMGAGMSVDKTVTLGNMDMKSKFSQDVKKITSAASKLKIHSKRSKSEKEKTANVIIASTATTTINNRLDQQPKQVQQPVVVPQEAPVEEKKKVENSQQQVEIQLKKEIPTQQKLTDRTSMPVPPRAERRWTLTDLLHCLGNYVNHQCRGLLSRPTAPEVAMWIRCTDKALQLNGWTVNSFLLESHVVFTYCLLQLAFERLNFNVRTLTDAKELVLMCLYISYTYNANEISYPLRPFLVKQDRVAFWSKCTELSFASSRTMLTLNRDRSYYKECLSQLKSLTTASFH